MISITGMRFLTLFPTLLFLVTASLVCEAANPVAFFEKHCMDCHDDDTRKGSLSLESLSKDYAHKDHHETWVRIHDRIQSGEMPPKDKKQPTTAERNAFLKTLDDQLHKASRKMNEGGRVTIRRLSRIEYENTLHDLLDIAVELKSGLPEDNLVHGFDNISSGLETSSTHLVRYQEAADNALSSFFAQPFPDQEAKTIKLTGKEWFESVPKVYHKNIVPYTYVEGDNFVYRAELWGDNSIRTPLTKLPGRYQFRCSVRAKNSKGEPIPFHVAKVRVDRFGRQDLLHMLGIYDGVENQTSVIEMEVDLPANESIYVSPYRLKHFRYDFGIKPIPEDHDGPEFVVEWIELKGPLGLGKAREQFVGDLERVPHRYVEQVMTGNRKGLSDWTRWHRNEFQKPHNRLRFISKNPKEAAASRIAAFLPKAIRRKPSEELQQFYVSRANQFLDQEMPLDEVLYKIYKEILCSVDFLFRIEKPGKLDSYALASRLSYMLWNSMPDDELLDLADSGKLVKPEVLRAQANRMINHWKAKRFLQHFPDRWLNLGEFQEMKPDKLYGEWDEDLAWSMPLETRMFFKEMLHKNRPVHEFVHSDWSFLNERMALHYGIDGVEGMTMRKMKLPPEAHRGGVITHGSLLKLTTNATYTSPIKRGVWLLERILGTPPHPPPPDVAAIEPDIRGAVTIREQMLAHQAQPVCASCHRKIDPPGFALENFDVLGGWRERYRVARGGEGIDHVVLENHPRKLTEKWEKSPVKVFVAKPVEPGGQTSDGTPFANIDEFKKILLQDKDQIAKNLAEQLLIYGTGSTLHYADRRTVKDIVSQTRKHSYGFKSLILHVIQSEVFLSK